MMICNLSRSKQDLFDMSHNPNYYRRIIVHISQSFFVLLRRFFHPFVEQIIFHWSFKNHFSCSSSLSLSLSFLSIFFIRKVPSFRPLLPPPPTPNTMIVQKEERFRFKVKRRKQKDGDCDRREEELWGRKDEKYFKPLDLFLPKPVSQCPLFQTKKNKTT